MSENAIAREFNLPSLLKFALPTIIMMVFMSLYTIVDGFFVSRFVGTDALSAVNIVYPLINVVLAVAIMLATGGSAVIARKMGEGNLKEARGDFSLIVLSGVIAGTLITVTGIIFLEPIVSLLGASPALMPYCKSYLFILLLFAPASVLQMLFQTFFVTAGKPMHGLWLTVLAGVVNAVFDYVLIVPFGMGIAGAALATAMGYLIPAGYGIWFFLRKKSALHFGKPHLSLHVLTESCFNGSSEMVTNLSMGIITFLFNIMMMQYLGSDGVAAITIVMYAQFLLTAFFLGFSLGVAPVISYNHGSENVTQIKRLIRICIGSITVSSIAIFVVSMIFSSGLVSIFSPKGTAVYDIAIQGFLLFSINYLFCGINIFSSSMFTAFSNGKVSAIISFMRTFVFILLGLLFLPRLFDVNGLWLAVPFAEFLTMILSVFYLIKGRTYYQYG